MATTVRPRANELTASRWTTHPRARQRRGPSSGASPPTSVGGGVTAAPMRTKIGSQARLPPAPGG